MKPSKRLKPSIFHPRSDNKKPQLPSGTVVATVSKSKGVRTLCLGRYDNNLQDAELCHPDNGFEVNPYRLRNESGLVSPYFVLTRLRYDPKEKISTVIHQRTVHPIHSCSDLVCEPRELAPYQYQQVTIVSDAAEVPPLCLSTNPRVGLLRPSESLALLLLLYGSMDIAQASRGCAMSEASVRSSAAALTRKKLIVPVGKGTMINVDNKSNLRVFLHPLACRYQWITSLLYDDQNQRLELMRKRIPVRS